MLRPMLSVRAARPKLEHLEARLVPGDALLGVLFASSFERPSLSCGKITLPDPGALALELNDLNVETLRSAPRCKAAASTARIEGLEITLVRETAMAAELATSTESHRVRRSAVVHAGSAIVTTNTLSTSPSVQALTTPRPALAHEAFATHAVSITNSSKTAAADEAQKSQARQNYGTLSLSFEANQGQTDARVDFTTRAGKATVFLTPTSAVFAIQNSESTNRASVDALARRESGLTQPGSPEALTGVALHMQIVGGNPEARAAGVSPLSGTTNYFVGNDPSQWHANIPTFGRVEYDDVYPGIDLIYYGNNGQLEYDFVVSPGADPNAIALNFAGADAIEINPRGDLILHTAVGDVAQQKPYLYQDVNGVRQEVAGEFRIQKSEFGIENSSLVTFDVGAYDPGRPLVIDPVVLGYSTYLGGPFGGEMGEAIVVDSGGHAYVAGRGSVDFPTTPGAFQTTGNSGAFVSKFSADGSALVYSTLLSGSSVEWAHGLTVDVGGNAYLTGWTQSADFPTTPGAFDTTHNGTSAGDVFVTKLNNDGSALHYSTFLGAPGNEYGYEIAIDGSGHAYVAGWTDSSGFPTTPGAFDISYNGGSSDVFVTKLNPDGSALVYSTFIGGSGGDGGYAIAVNAGGNAFVTGYVSSANFPTTPGAFDTTYTGSGSDAFVTKLSTDGSALDYSTYLGGSNSELGWDIVADSAGSAYVTGYVFSTNFPTTPGAFDTTYNGSRDAFVTKLNAVGSALVYSTFLGGSGLEIGFGIAVDASGNAYVTGDTESTNFPTTPGTFDATQNGASDAYVTKLNAAGSALVYSTYLGGSGEDFGTAIAVEGSRSAYVTGYTASSNFPTTPGAFDTSYNGDSDAWVTKLCAPACRTTVNSTQVLP